MSSDENPLVLPGVRAAARREVPKPLAERYIDIQFLGEGGMGVVYRAVDPRLGRKVALKLLKGDDPDRRFIGEARSQARVQHEHICRVYEAGEADGEPFIAMQFIDGEPLSKARERLTLEERVFLMKEVSLAVHEAHRIGLIHRDLKPGNIIVEEREDGAKKPWVMDFGLAREVEEKGQTQTGAVVGTVAFMPPEQARGDVRAMDRRSDVYSLGATLYDVIAGRPPFVAEHPWKLLMMVGYDDAPALGKVKKGVPEELETIVMKCLEREPSRRYDSARALAEDLQRFLDGEPILAKRASLGYVFLKKVKKNRLLSAALAVVVLSSLSFAGVWIRAQRQAAAREKLAQELGESVKEMELFLRAAYELPLHDVERERDVVRARLGEFEERLSSAGKNGEGPLHYAIGRGHLALGDPALAREHLEKALAAGYSSLDLEYALGRALGELFRRAVEETKRITNKEEQKRKVEELERTLRDPALGHLRKATGARIESPLYAEGLVAFYEGKNDEAIEKARKAFEKAPWLYEPKKLEGDALFAEGSKYRHDAAFDYEKMKGYFEPAAAAYKIAGEMGSSDPEVYRAECELWGQWMNAEFGRGGSIQQNLAKANDTCGKAIEASPGHPDAKIRLALVLTNAAYRLADEPGPGTEQAIADAVKSAQEAVRVAPQDAMAHWTLGASWQARALYASNIGLDCFIPFEQAVFSFQNATNIDPTFLWAVKDMALASSLGMPCESLRGRDPAASFKRALAQLSRAEELDPGNGTIMFFRGYAHLMMAEHLVRQGRSPREHVEAAHEIWRGVKVKAPSVFQSYLYEGRTYLASATFQLASGADPRASLEAASAEFEHAAAAAPSNPWIRLRQSVVLELRARRAAALGEDPMSFLAEARKPIESALQSAPWSLEVLVERASIEVLALRWALKEKQATQDRFEAALSPLLPLLERSRTDPTFYQILAELFGLRGQWRLEQRRREQAAADLSKARSYVHQALALNPHMASALQTKGEVLLLLAHSVADAEEKKTTAREARDAFRLALEESSLLRRSEATAWAKEAERLAAGEEAALRP